MSTRPWCLCCDVSAVSSFVRRHQNGQVLVRVNELLSFEMQSFPITTVHDCLFERFTNITLATNDSHLSRDNNYLADIFRAIHLKCRIKIKL